MIKASDFIVKTQGVKAKAGYIVKDSQSSSVLYFFSLSDSSMTLLDGLYIPDTKVGQPQYAGYIITPSQPSDSTDVGSQSTQTTSDSQSQSVSLSESTSGTQPEITPQQSESDPYGDDLLYSIFINGGPAWSRASQNIVTTDNYTSNVETVGGITARKFEGSEAILTTAGTTRSTFSYSVWVKKAAEEYGYEEYPVGATGVPGLALGDDGHNITLMSTSGTYMCSTAFNYSLTNWYHYVVTYDGSTYTMYMNSPGNTWSGTYQSSGFTLFPSGSAGLTFGRRYQTESQNDNSYFKGYIANFRLYGHVLTSDQITALYNEHTPSN